MWVYRSKHETERPRRRFHEIQRLGIEKETNLKVSKTRETCSRCGAHLVVAWNRQGDVNRAECDNCEALIPILEGGSKLITAGPPEIDGRPGGRA